MTQRLAQAQAPDSNRGHSKSRKQCPVELYVHGGRVSRWCVWAEKTVWEKLTESPGGGGLRISSDGDDGRSFLGYEIAQATQTLWEFVGLLIYKRMTYLVFLFY